MTTLDPAGRDEGLHPGASAPHRVVILGGGFGGLSAARALHSDAVQVTLIDRRNFHLFPPLLYQVATGALSPGDIASPLRTLLRAQENATVVLGDADGIDPHAREVRLADGARVPYHSLIVATGARHAYFGHDEWERFAPGLKSVEDALEIRRRVLLAYEAAEREGDRASRADWLRFAVVGAGPTGVELAGALAEIARDDLRAEFRGIEPRDAEIQLLELVDRVLPTYPEDLSRRAADALARLGVTVRTGTRVTAIDERGVTVEREGRTERIGARTVLWAAGVQASSLGRVLHEAAGAELDAAGRVLVASDLTIPGQPDIFVIGDLARYTHRRSSPLPGVAPVAIQQGEFAARAIWRRLRGRGTGSFRFRDKGTVATIGRGHAVADLHLIHLDGRIAWLSWLLIHLAYLSGFENRLLVLIQWTWNFFTRRRGVRLITGTDLQPALETPAVPGIGDQHEGRAADRDGSRHDPVTGATQP